MQGHKLYDLITYIGKLVCRRKRVAFKSEVLDSAFPVAGYEEIDNEQSDLSVILHQWVDTYNLMIATYGPVNKA